MDQKDHLRTIFHFFPKSTGVGGESRYVIAFVGHKLLCVIDAGMKTVCDLRIMGVAVCICDVLLLVKLFSLQST